MLTSDWRLFLILFVILKLTDESLESPDEVFISAQAIPTGSDIDWGPIGVDRHRFVNVMGSRYKSLNFTCSIQSDVASSSDLKFKWFRDGIDMNISTVDVTFKREEELYRWIGLVSCQVSRSENEQIAMEPGFQFSVWDVVALLLVADCPSCKAKELVTSAEYLMKQYIDAELGAGQGNRTKFHYFQEPRYEHTELSWIVHLTNPSISNFDYHLVQKMKHELILSQWASQKSIKVVPEAHIVSTALSPCSCYVPEDAESGLNVTWISYPGQVVPSGNIIGGPICVDRSGRIITRTCGRGSPHFPPADYQKCEQVKKRREEPDCPSDYRLIGELCYRMTPPVTLNAALNQCRSSWMYGSSGQTNLTDWIARSLRFVQEMEADWQHERIWLPLKRSAALTPLRYPVWARARKSNWTSNAQWEKLDVETAITSSIDVSHVNRQLLCLAYDLQSHQVISVDCFESLPMICHLSAGKKPPSDQQQVAQYHCPLNWVTHPWALQSSTCYRRFKMNKPVSWDEAAEHCRSQGGHLATAATHERRVVLDETYRHFNDKESVDSWIGMRALQEGRFAWVSRQKDEWIEGETYAWQPYNEFGDGYGVSTGITRMWWSWPSSVRLWGMVCQRQVDFTGRHLLMLLEHAGEATYTLNINYDPDYNGRASIPNWLSRGLNVACYTADLIQRFDGPLDWSGKSQVQLNVTLPGYVKSAQLSCEAWMEQPAFRTYSNLVHYQSKNTWTYIIRMIRKESSLPTNLTSDQDLINDFRLNLNQVIRANGWIMDIDPWLERDSMGRQLVNYRVSITLPTDMDKMQVLSLGNFCALKPHGIADVESAVYLLIHSCLELAYTSEEDELKFQEIKSTVACQPESSAGLTWLRTAIGTAARSEELCLSESSHYVSRFCGGSYDRGALWEDVSLTCYPASKATTELHTLEIRSRDETHRDITSLLVGVQLNLVDQKSKGAMTVADVQLTIPLLKRLLHRASVQTPDLHLVANIMEQILNADDKIISEVNEMSDTIIDLLDTVTILAAQWGTSLEYIPGLRNNITFNWSQFNDWTSNSSIEATDDREEGTEGQVKLTVGQTEVVARRFPSQSTLRIDLIELPVQLFAVHVNDRRFCKEQDPDDGQNFRTIGPFALDSDVVHVNIGMEYPATYHHFWLKLPAKSRSDGTRCARWEPSTDRSADWTVDDCKYLGLSNGSHLCQCRRDGVIAVLRPGDESKDVYYAAQEAPIMGATAVFFLASLALVIGFFWIIPRKQDSWALSLEFCWVEGRVLVQLLTSWLILLVADVIVRFVADRSTSCVLFTTLWQYALFVSAMWVALLVIHHRRQLLNKLVVNRSIYLMELSFVAWGIPSAAVLTIPLYKWEKSGHASIHNRCYLEEKNDLAVTLIPVVSLAIVTFIVIVFNCVDKRYALGYRLLLADYWSTAATASCLMTASIVATLSNSVYESFALNCTFALLSLFLGLALFMSFRRLLTKGLEPQPTTPHVGDASPDYPWGMTPSSPSTENLDGPR